MKKIHLVVISLLLALTSMAASAEPIKSEQEISGTWYLVYTKLTPTAPDSENKPMGITWVIKNGTLIQKDIPQARGDHYDSEPVKFVIEDGLLKVSVLGRAGKFDTYSLEEKTDTAMVLKDTKFGSYLYFTKK